MRTCFLLSYKIKLYCKQRKSQFRRGRRNSIGQKIAVITDSPHRNGNTSALVSAFTKGAEQAGNSVTEFFINEMDIHGCKGCFGGNSARECPCVQKDDMTKLYPAIKKERCGCFCLTALLLTYERSEPLQTGFLLWKRAAKTC